MSVDSWLESAGMEKVDMIKMDVQGAEAMSSRACEGRLHPVGG